MTKRPDQYTTEPNNMPAPLWAGDGKYWNPEYLKHVEKRDALEARRSPTVEAPEAIDAHTWNSGTFGKRLAQRQCLSCDGWFTPSNGNQMMCSDQCREARRKEMVNRNYQLKPLPVRTCEICNVPFRPEKPLTKTCSTECRDELRKVNRRREAAARKGRLAS